MTMDVNYLHRMKSIQLFLEELYRQSLHKQADELTRNTGKRWDLIPEPAINQSADEIIFHFSTYSVLPSGEWYSGDSEEQGKKIVEAFKQLTRLIGGRWDKNDPKANSYDDTYYIFTSRTSIGGNEEQGVPGVTLRLRMERNLVCERVQVGTEKKVIPAVEAVEAQPERVEEVPVYERECKPLFKGADKELDEFAKELTA